MDELWVGIDEAGRGPVLGPLVIAAVWIRGVDLPALVKAGVADSKKLSPEKREALYPLITGLAVASHRRVISPAAIDRSLADPADNLNKLEIRAMLSLLKRHAFAIACVDAPLRNPAPLAAKWQLLLAPGPAGFPKAVIRLEHKADDRYPVCAAASIIAKVTRDRLIAGIARDHGPCGSGYPSDPATISFLKHNGKRLPHLFRTSWQTYHRHFGPGPFPVTEK